MTYHTSALFIDFDNVVSTLDRDSEGLGRRFSSRPLAWLTALEQQFERNADIDTTPRRIVSRRCYASPQRINQFRTQFTQTGFEVIDCPPLTSRMKNSADIYVVMDIIDFLTRFSHIDEFIILSADADFVPVLNRLRKELKRSVIFTAFDTASAYKNCSDSTIDPSFFRDLLTTDAASARPAAVSVVQVAQVSTRPNDFWERIEKCLISAANKRLGKLPYATAAQSLREELPELVGQNWSGKSSFTRMMQDAQLSRLVLDNDVGLYILRDFELDLNAWCPEDKKMLEEFVFDVVSASSKPIPILGPKAYSTVFDALAASFNKAPSDFTTGIHQASDIASEVGEKISPQDMRFIATGISMRGYRFDDEKTKLAEEIAAFWRINIYDLCGEPEWLGEQDDANLLAYWCHATSESVNDARRQFLDAITIGDEGVSDAG